MSDRFRNSLEGAWKRIEERQWIYGKAGRLNSDGTYTFIVPGRPTFIYVTLRNASGSQTTVSARNDGGVPHAPNLNVKMRLEKGIYVVYGRSGTLDANNPATPNSGVDAHKIENHSDVVLTSIADNEGLTWDAATSKWINTVVVHTAVAGEGIVIDDTDPANPIITALPQAGAITLFLENAASDVGTYKLMDSPVSEPSPSTVTYSSPVHDGLAQAWATAANYPGLTFVPAGLWECHVHAYKTGGTKTVQLYAKFYKRAAGGTETLLGTTGLSQDLTTVDVHLAGFYASVGDQTLLVTDRLVCKVYVSITGLGTSPTSVSIVVAGDTGSRMDLPGEGYNPLHSHSGQYVDLVNDQTVAGIKTFTSAPVSTFANATVYVPTDATHTSYLSIDNTSETTGASAGIAMKVEPASGSLQRWFMGLVSTASNWGRFVIKQRTGVSTYAERFSIGETGNLQLGGAGEKVGVGVAPTYDLSVFQPNASGKGIFLTGYEYDTPASTDTTADGVLLMLGVNRTGNRQLWIIDDDNLGSATKGGFRTWGDNVSPYVVNIGAITGDGNTVLPMVVNANGMILLEVDQEAQLQLRRYDLGITAGDDIGGIFFQVTDPEVTTNINSAAIRAEAVSTITTNINPTDLYFQTTGSGLAGALTERMRIYSTGGVNISVPDSGTTLTVGRILGQSSIKSSTSSLAIDSNSGHLYLNNLVVDNVYIAAGGGNVYTYNTLTVAGTAYVKAGSSTGSEARVGGVMYITSTQGANVSTGVTTLASYSVPANTLATNNDTICFEAWGTVANVNGFPYVRFGATTIFTGFSSATGGWYIRGSITRTGATAQKGFTTHLNGGVADAQYNTIAETLSNANILYIRGQGTASNQIYLEYFRVWFEPNNT